MKEKKIITGLIIFNLITISIIFNLLVNKTINSEKQIIKKMSATEYENSITALNTSHENYANQITQYKVNLANAITAKNVPTSADADFETIINNISQIATIHDGTQDITSNGTTDLGATHNVRYITTNIPHPTHTETQTITSNGTTDLGATNNIRYINTNIGGDITLVYHKNYSDYNAHSFSVNCEKGNYIVVMAIAGNSNSGNDYPGDYSVSCTNGTVSVLTSAVGGGNYTGNGRFKVYKVVSNGNGTISSSWINPVYGLSMTTVLKV